jgi:hypothetical protein
MKNSKKNKTRQKGIQIFKKKGVFKTDEKKKEEKKRKNLRFSNINISFLENLFSSEKTFIVNYSPFFTARY